MDGDARPGSWWDRNEALRVGRAMLVLALGALATLAARADEPQPAAPAPPRRPNVVLLVADDLRADAVATPGGWCRTPNLDRLAARGVRFRHAVNLGGNSAAVCLPSRNMLFSGRAYFRWAPKPMAPADAPNLPVAFAAAGYQTYHHGKRGNVARDIQAKFDQCLYLDDEKERTSGHPGRAATDGALAFLKGRDKTRPFLLSLSYEAPHDPKTPAAEDLALYPEGAVGLPANYLPLHPFDNGEMTVRDERLAPWPRTEAEIRRHRREYAAVVTGLDRQVGRLLDALEAEGALANTLVVFTSDNGLALGSHGLMGKQNLYEHSVGVPLVVAGPGVTPGRTTAAFAYLMDLFPTLCDLAGLPVPEGLDGRSLAPVLRGESDGVRAGVVLAYRDVQRGVRMGRWKLIRYPQIDRTQLFDLEADPDERNDLAADPAQRARIASLLDELRDRQARLGDAAPLTVPHPKPDAFTPPPASPAVPR
jgi:arylsulfatase A-like enzyme